MSKPMWTKEQQLVIDLRDRNILVSAAAGSGKTAVLVERIIDEVTQKDAPKDIDRLLVVTFTKAAAAEMRTRIGNALELRLEENPDNEHLQKQASLLHLAQITTIDSFCQSIIKNYFHVINLDPVFTVGDETDLGIMKQEVLAELIEERYARAKEENDQAFLAFTDVFSPGRTDSGIEELVLSLYDISRSYPWPEEWLDSVDSMYQASTPAELETTEWMKKLVLYLSQSFTDFIKIARKALTLCMDEGGPEAYTEAIRSDLDYLERFEGARTYGDFEKLFAQNNPVKLKAIRGSQCDAQKKEQVKAYREMYRKKGIDELYDKFFFQSTEDMLHDIKEMAQPVRELVKLTKEFTEAFSAKKREEGILDFADIEHFALQILVRKTEAGVYPSETALELQNYYEEILTDEYQDSNYVQELLLNSLCCEADENMQAEGFLSEPVKAPYLFMVGDVKQSIYKFRLARPDLFLHKYENYTEGKGSCQRIDLHQNFRSRASVLESANAIFEKIMTKSLGGIIYDESASLVPGADFGECDGKVSGKTEVVLIDEKSELEEVPDKKSLEAAWIGQRIKEMMEAKEPLQIRDKNGYRSVAYGDIAILLRSLSGWSETFIEVLNEMGIPAYADTKTGYFTTIEVETVLNLLHVIDNPRQDIPLTAVLRSVFGRISDEELAWIGSIPTGIDFWDRVQQFIGYMRWKAGDKEIQDTFARMGVDLGKLDRLLQSYKDVGQTYKKLMTFLERIEEYQKYAQTRSVYELLRRIYNETGYYDYMASMPAGEKRRANLDILLQQSIEFAQNGHQGIFGFTRYIESLQKSDIDFGEAAVNDENTNAVRIMTIHKSKGLEFPVAFVAGMGKQFNLMDARKGTIIDGDYGVGCDYVDMERRVKKPTLMKRFMANAIVLETLAEEIRVLYVALTRAKEQLIICGTVKDAQKSIEKWNLRASLQSVYQLSKAQTYLDWIATALLDRNRLREGLVYNEMQTAEDELYMMQIIKPENIIEEEAEALEDTMLLRHALQGMDTSKIYDEKMRDALAQRMSYCYPYASEAELPIKVSVSELKRQSIARAERLAEEVEISLDIAINAVENGVEIPRPAFLQEDKELSGAARGTLYHLVMEHFPYAQIAGALGDWTGVNFEEYLLEMVSQGHMTKEEMALLDCQKFVTFLSTDIGKRMAQAAADKTLRLEQPFMLGLKASDIYPEQDSEEIIMVQGIIDAFFFEGDDIILVDYKTDSVKGRDGQALVKKYKAQLEYYAEALERLTGRKVRQKIIYSFALGQEIEV